MGFTQPRGQEQGSQGGATESCPASSRATHITQGPLQPGTRSVSIFETRVMTPSLWDCHGDSEWMSPARCLPRGSSQRWKLQHPSHHEVAFLKVGVNRHNAKLVSRVQRRLEIASERYVGFFTVGLLGTLTCSCKSGLSEREVVGSACQT